MKVLYITPSRGELHSASAFDAAFIGIYAKEISNNVKDFCYEILNLSELDLKDLSLRDVESILAGTKTALKDFDAIHTFSIFPFINRNLFGNLIFYSFDLDALRNDFGAFFSNINNLHCEDLDAASVRGDKAYGIYENAVHYLLSFDVRPWGWWRTIISTERYKVKQIFVAPGQKLSLQTHEFRSETWAVAEGHGFITIGDHRYKAEKGLVFMIQKHEPHRAETTADSSMTIIELQLGSYLGEDDVKRIEDIYGRI